MGYILTTGTDSVIHHVLPGFSVQGEMELFVETGLKPRENFNAATVNGTFAIGRSDQLGSIEVGDPGIFFILNANPQENISNADSVHKVVKGGVICDPEQLLKPLIGKIH